ncbi:MAG: efflux RND transporter permease subunit [Paludibacteraceae bacterium]|nr:efflux RND transporter permease subunit [Paludibacteraceae bacterium]
MKSNWVAWLMRSYRITFLIIVLLFGLGIFGFMKMGKAEFPEFVIRQGVVVAVYPGASAEEIEEQVARPLERYLFTYDEVKRSSTTTTSTNGMCIVMVDLQNDVNNKDEVWSKIKHGLNSFKTLSLPSGVAALIVNDDFGAASALLIAIESDSRSYRDLKKYADDIADDLRKIPSVSNAVLYGDKKEQISIYIDPQRLAAYGIGKINVIQSLQSAGFTTLSGSISGNMRDIPIHVKPTLSSEQEIENQIIYSDLQNHVVRLKDVADIKREYDTSDSYIEYNGHPCVLLSLEMMEGNNIIHYGEEVQKVLDDYTTNKLPADVNISRIADQCQVVDSSVNDFMVNLLEAMAIIVIVMLVLFPWRTAIVAGITIPMSTFISLGIMYLCAIPLNTVTLAALVIVLGMVVDNAIVVLDGYLEFLNKGMNRWHAAAESAQHYFMPMMLATLCISVIFFPFLFVLSGMFGDFIYWLPWTIFINLIVSLVLAIIVIPILEVFIIKRSKKREKKKKDITEYVQEYYEKILNWTFQNPWLTIGGSVAAIVLSFVLIVPRLGIRMMPVADRNQFAVEVFLPAGSGLNETKAIVDSVYATLKADPEVTSITSFVGCSSPRFHACYAPKIGGRNYAQLIVNTTSNKATEQLLDKYEPLYSEHYPNAFVKFKQLDFQMNPPFEYRFYGEDIDSLRTVADALMAEMQKDPRFMNVHTDWEEARPIIEVALDPIQSSQLGISRTLTELQLSMATGSMKIGQVWEGNYEVPLVLRNRKSETLDYESINDLYISAVGTTSVPLRQVGTAQPVWAATNIVHRKGERCLTVTADLVRTEMSQNLHKEMRKLTSQLTLPEGVSFEIGGEPEDDALLTADILKGLAIAVIIIFFFILFNFKKYKLTGVCLVAIIVCAPGSLLGFLLMNRALGLTAIFGVVTLMGMIMRNEILIFEHANGLVRSGVSAKEAAYDAGKRRMVPIFLTTSTTAVGVVPMIIAATNFWMPVGVAIFAGGIGALIMVVTVLPVIYWKLNEKKN